MLESLYAEGVEDVLVVDGGGVGVGFFEQFDFVFAVVDVSDFELLAFDVGL